MDRVVLNKPFDLIDFEHVSRPLVSCNYKRIEIVSLLPVRINNTAL